MIIKEENAVLVKPVNKYNIKKMQSRLSIILSTLACLFCFCTNGHAQEITAEENNNPVILYSATPKKYEIGGIKVEGVKNYEDYVLIGLSGLSVGQTVTVPGDDITTAVKRYWRHGLFSDVRIEAEKIVGNKIYLKIVLSQRPRIAEIRYQGIKKSEREDLETKLGSNWQKGARCDYPNREKYPSAYRYQRTNANPKWQKYSFSSPFS